jgi:hypothetical protein
VFLEGVCLKVLSGTDGSVVEATYTTGWWLDQKEYSDVVAGKKYKRLVVEDVEGCRLSVLRAATAMQVGDTRFKFAAKTSFIGSVPSYEFKLQPTGERV